MSDKKQRKTIIAYAAGILILAVCTVAAWFFPEAYGRWQDQRQIGQVQLSDREMIEFLDSNSLGQIGRWKMLADCMVMSTVFSWSNSEAWEFTIQTNLDEFIQACSDEAIRWHKNGLLPFSEDKIKFSADRLCFAESRILYAGEKIIPVAIFSFYLDNDIEDGYITVIMDMETKRAYYMSAFGNDVQEYMAEQLGYDSFQDMKVRLQSGEQVLFSRPDTSRMDFASVCGAERDYVTANPGTLELEAELQYDSFQTAAYRCVVQSEYFRSFLEDEDTYTNYGLAVMFGPTGYPALFADSLYNTGVFYNGSWEMHEFLADTSIFLNDIIAGYNT